MSYIPFDQESVFNALNKLRPNAAGGPDGLQPCFLRRVSKFIAYPLSVMYESFFLNTYVPPIWKIAFVRPIFKSGSANQTSNYRPISLTCTCSKIMESIVSRHMLEFLFENDLISEHQYGFLPRRSTCSQATRLVSRLDSGIIRQKFTWCHLPRLHKSVRCYIS